jgi:biotin transport system substrate-specific component
MGDMNDMERTSVTALHRETASERTRSLTKMALCVALMAISSYLAFPLPFTPTMVVGTTIIVNMTAFVLKPGDAALVVIAWLMIGAIGVPVLPGGTAGLGRLAGPTGGFYVAFVVSAWLMSKMLNGSNSFRKMVFLGIAAGMPVIYIGGCISMYLVAHMNVWATLVAAVFPFIFGDVVKVVAGAFLATRINAFLKK